MPLLLVVADEDTDPFVAFMVNDEASIDGFLTAGPSGATVVLSSRSSSAAQAALESRITARLQLQESSVQKAWADRLYFTNGPAPKAVSAELLGVLDTWHSPRNIISASAGAVNVSRLDCRYAWGPWPSQDEELRLSYAGDACSLSNSSNVTLASKDVLLTVSQAQNCSIDAGIAAVIRAGAGNIVLAQPEGSLLVPMGAAAPESQGPNAMVTSVSAEGGRLLKKLIDVSVIINVTLPTQAGPGQLLAVDARGRLQEVGWEKYATLQMVTWEAAWLGYTARLHKRLSHPAFVLPVFDRAPVASSVAVQMPPRTLLQSFASMQLDFSLSCAGNMDRDCQVWDRIVSVAADCGVGSFEVGRWINPFQRRVGRWLTSTPLLPAFYPSGDDSSVCNFTASIGLNNPWLVSLNLRFAHADAAAGEPWPGEQPAWGQPALALPVVFPNASDSFDGPGYNDNRTMLFRMGFDVTRVAVAAIITGHSGCEFQPTSHHWIINGKERGSNTLDPRYYDRFMQAGTPFGCANKTARGAVPNEHGTWYFGRNGWCDGQDVKPIVIDVTGMADLTPGAMNNLTYYARSYSTGDLQKPDDKGCSGNIDLSTYVVMYQGDH